MGKKVYANDMEIAHKAGDGKVIAAFPDVCLSPPPPPAGPVPVPYPNTSFAKDLKEGSTTVVIGGKPLALKDQSYYQTSPLGDEAATRNFGGSVVTHTISGKTYFQAHSMDVVVEGKNVCRHLDITTSNHASYPGSTPPLPNAEDMVAQAQERIAEEQCPCCGTKTCPARFTKDDEPQSLEDFYGLNEKGPDGKLTEEAAVRMKVYTQLIAIKERHCTCEGQVFPKAPCDVFRPANSDRTKDISKKWRESSLTYANNFRAAHPEVIPTFRQNNPREIAPRTEGTFGKGNHLTPKGAGGCPDNPGNLQPHDTLCSSCKMIDDQFGRWQGEAEGWRTKWNEAFRASGIKRKTIANFVPNWW